MIRRPAGSDFLLIAQADHAVLSGQFAEQLGNQRFDAPAPRESAILGIAMHDSGWPLHDDRPTLNSHGLPLHVFETPMDIAVRVWSESAARAESCDAYAGLLVSLHVMALSDIAWRHDAMPHEREHSASELLALNKFQHNQVEVQERLRNKLGMRTDLPLHFGLAKRGSDEREDRLRSNFRWLTAMDRISLQLCCDKPLFERIEEIYPSIGAAAVELRLASKSAPAQVQALPSNGGAPTAACDRLSINPWPFHQPKMTFEIPARRLTAQPFAAIDAFRAAFDAAPTELLQFELYRNDNYR